MGRGRSRRGRRIAASVAAAVVVIGVALARLAPPIPSDVAEPPATASFLAAFARGDVAGAERVASPLYRLERARRGTAPASDRPPSSSLDLGGERGPRLRFELAGGAADSAGFRHLIYAVGSACDVGCRATSVWRVDAEPSGRVIWAEMVWLFGQRVAGVVASSDPGDLPTELLPDDLAQRGPSLVAAVRSDRGPEGFYEVALGAVASDLAFLAITRDGDVRPGAWSFGRPLADASSHEIGRARAPLQVAPEYESLRRAYVSALP